MVFLEAEDLNGGVYWSIWRGGERIGGTPTLSSLGYLLKRAESASAQIRGGELVACGPVLEWSE